jgi:hypothetical protein
VPCLPDRRSLNYVLENLPFTRLHSLEEGQQFCDLIGYTLTPDVRLQVWDLTVVDLHPFTLQGWLSSPKALNGLRRACETLGLDLNAEHVTLLPDRLTVPDPFALVTSLECPLYSTPERTERVDTAVPGEYIFPLRRENDMFLVQIPNGYIGWAEALNFRILSREDWIRWCRYDRALFVCDWEQDGILIPGGTELPLISDQTVLLPTGTPMSVDKNLIVSSSPQQSQQYSALLAVAQTLLGTPYVWGGCNSKGIDCSGFTRYVYSSIGYHLPRDADQQFRCGKISALPGTTETLTAGDLLFFAGSCGGIGHVGIAVEPPETFIHAKGGQGVIISKLSDSEEFHGRFLLAKRMIR